MLARPLDSGISAEHPFRGAIVTQPYPEPLDADMHDAFEIGIVLSGQEDRHFEDLVIRLRRGDVWLSPAWEPHGRRTTAPRTRELVLQFLPEFLGEEMLAGRSWLTLFATSPRGRPRVSTAEQRRRIISLAEGISRELQQQARGWLTEVRLSTLQLLSTISRGWGHRESAHDGRRVRRSDLARVLPALRAIHSHPERRVDLSDAAAACALSVSHFSFVFRRTMGSSFARFALRARLAYAAQVLATTESSVEAIAERFGFVDGSHFALAFARHYRVSPTRYRRDGRPLPHDSRILV
jgi:AraC-like DNA-binding protein